MTLSPQLPTVVSCGAQFGYGGLGRHLAELVAGVRSAGDSVRYYAAGVPAGDSDGEAVAVRWLPWAFRFTPVRFSHGWKIFLGGWGFDYAVAGRLLRGRTVTAFAGAALRTFRRARRLGYAELHLESASAHVCHARRRYDEAYRRHPVEGDWLAPRLRARILAEYDLADVIWVNSEYARQTFLAEGVPADKLRWRALTVDPRFRPPPVRPENSGPQVLYVGSLTVSKGVPILVEAFARYPDPNARLTLVGSSGTRGMARWLVAALARDSRVRVAPGDPLPHLLTADVCVHPSYSDGFGYAPAEALACGVPVIVTEDTGMKELVREGVNGFVVPTGSVDALHDCIEHLINHPLPPAAA
jgi:glycosyltransferase involved in cell wall biosynthesis